MGDKVRGNWVILLGSKVKSWTDAIKPEPPLYYEKRAKVYLGLNKTHESVEKLSSESDPFLTNIIQTIKSKDQIAIYEKYSRNEGDIPSLN